MIRVIGMLLLLYLSIMVVYVGLAAAIVLGLIGVGVGLIFYTRQTLEVIAIPIGLALICSYPVPCLIIFVLGLLFGVTKTAIASPEAKEK